jgi:hypothetical protein
MNAVWSFWSKPYREGKSLDWGDGLSRFCSWKLSLEMAGRLFGKTMLFTDDYGKNLLVSKLGLKYDSVSTALNALESLDSKWWASGKLYTYLLQDEPFLHIDSDVYLHKQLDRRLLDAPLIAQNYEHFRIGDSWYHPEKFRILKSINGFLPEEIIWYIDRIDDQKALCCGVFGGNDLRFIRYYASVAFDMFLHPDNHAFWIFLGGDNILLEQYVLSACIEYSKSHPESVFYHSVDIECLFDSASSAFNPESSSAVGYTHLIGGAKKNPDVCARLKNRVLREYPDYYERYRVITGDAV